MKKYFFGLSVCLLMTLITNDGFAQTANGFDKATVLQEVQSLNSYTQNWIDTHYDNLSDEQINHFLHEAFLQQMRDKYSLRFVSLKRAMRGNAFDLAMRNLTEDRLLQLFEQYL